MTPSKTGCFLRQQKMDAFRTKSKKIREIRRPRSLARMYVCVFVHKVEPPCATTSYKRLPIQNTKTFPVKALQLEPS